MGRLASMGGWVRQHQWAMAGFIGISGLWLGLSALMGGSSGFRGGGCGCCLVGLVGVGLVDFFFFVVGCGGGGGCGCVCVAVMVVCSGCV